MVNYGPIAPEESRLIFAREALVYQRLARRPDWLSANDAAIRAAQLLEERLRLRDLVQPPEVFVDVLRRELAAAGIERGDARALHAALSAGAAEELNLTPRADHRAPAG